jgi:hypothetical protein
MLDRLARGVTTSPSAPTRLIIVHGIIVIVRIVIPIVVPPGVGGPYEANVLFSLAATARHVAN